MSNVYLITIIRGVTGFSIALLLSKIIGTKIISKMNFIDLVMGVSMGSMIASAVIDKEAPIESEITALILFSILTIFTSYISLKSIKVRNLISSDPVVLVKDGVILNYNMKKKRITTNELLMKLREKSVFNLMDVEYAIMESDGKVSVLVKADKKAITPYDMNIKVKSGGIVTDIIIDGNLIEKNMKIAGVDLQWIDSKLMENKINNIAEVFYGGVDENKKIILSKKL